MDPWANEWARDDDSGADKLPPFSRSPPLRALGSFQVSSSSAWSPSEAPEADIPPPFASSSTWSPKLTTAANTTEDTPWTSEIDPVALPLPSVARLNLDDDSQLSSIEHDSDQHGAQAFGVPSDARDTEEADQQDQFGSAPEFQPSDDEYPRSSSPARSETVQGSSKDHEQETEDVDWGKMELPPLRSVDDEPASPTQDEQSNGLDEEDWGAMDLPPLRTAEDALPTWGEPSEKAPSDPLEDGVDPWRPPEPNTSQAKTPPAEEPSPEELAHILEKMRQASEEATNIPPGAFSPPLGTNRSSSDAEAEPSPAQKRGSTEAPSRPPAQPSQSSSFLGSIFKRKTQPPATEAKTQSEDPQPSEVQADPGSKDQTEPPAVTSPTVAAGFSSFFSKSRTAASTSTPSSPKPSLDAARPAVLASSSSTPDNASASQPEQQTGGVRRFFTRFAKQPTQPNPDEEHQHVQPSHRVSDGTDQDDPDDGWLAKQEVRVLEMAGVSTLDSLGAAPRSASAPGLKNTNNLLGPSQGTATQAAPQATDDSSSLNAFFDAFEKQPIRTPVASTSKSAAAALDPFAAFVAPQQPKEPPVRTFQGIPLKMHQPVPNRPVSVPALPPPPSISRPTSVQSNTANSSRANQGLHNVPSRPSSSTIPSLPPPPAFGASPAVPTPLGAANKQPSIDDFGDFESSPAPSPAPTVSSFFQQQPLAPTRSTQAPASAAASGKLSKADFDFFEGL